MSRIDKDIALAMLHAGESDSNIAARFGTSRQAVNLLRKALIKSGRFQPPSTAPLAPVQDAAPPQAVATPPETTTPDQPPLPPATASYPTFEQISDWLVHLIGEATEAARLRQENALLRQRSDGLLAEVLRLQAVNRQAEENLAASMAKATQYQTAIQQSRLPPPANP
jgi:hypothetical protein